MPHQTHSISPKRDVEGKSFPLGAACRADGVTPGIRAMYERRVRVIYPLEGGRIVLSTGPAWDVHLEPEAVSDNGHQFEFTVRWAWASRLHLPVQLFSGKVARASQHFGRAERPPDAA